MKFRVRNAYSYYFLPNLTSSPPQKLLHLCQKEEGNKSILQMLQKVVAIHIQDYDFYVKREKPLTFASIRLKSTDVVFIRWLNQLLNQLFQPVMYHVRIVTTWGNVYIKNSGMWGRIVLCIYNTKRKTLNIFIKYHNMGEGCKIVKYWINAQPWQIFSPLIKNYILRLFCTI